jgi:hypothetical protein
MVKRSIVLISETFRERGMKSMVSLDMHDAIVCNVAHDEWDAALAIITDVMEHVVPQELNERTDPPITWIARPEPAKNAKKWGKFQPHPGDEGFKALVAPHVAPATSAATDPQARARERQKVALVQHIANLEARQKVLADLFTSLDKEFRGPYTVTLPVIDGAGDVITKTAQVDMANRVKVPLAWMSLYGKYDVAGITGLDYAEIEAQYNMLQAKLQDIQRRLDQWSQSVNQVSTELADAKAKLKNYEDANG